MPSVYEPNTENGSKTGKLNEFGLLGRTDQVQYRSVISFYILDDIDRIHYILSANCQV